MNVRSVRWRVWLPAALVLVWVTAAACGGSSGSGTTAVDASTAIASPAVGSASGAGATMLPVAGMQTLVKASAGPAGTKVALTYRNELSDPRLSGILTLKVTAVLRADASGYFEGSAVLSNDGGTWRGTVQGLVSAGGAERYSYVELKGAGAYAGLTSRGIGFAAEKDAAAPLGTAVSWAGAIESVDAGAVPAPAGTAQAPAGWTPVAGKTALIDAGRVWWTFADTSSDPRVTGTVKADIQADPARADGSTELWARYALRNDGGRWTTGHLTGARGIDSGEHFVAASAEGSGDYAGLTYHVMNHFYEEPGGGMTSDTPIFVAGWIEAAD
jgi:hypothetical protein